MDYKYKYLVYKKKYIELKQKIQTGGAMEYAAYDINPEELKVEIQELYRELGTANDKRQKGIRERIETIKELMMIHNRMQTDQSTEVVKKLYDAEPGIVQAIQEFTYMPLILEFFEHAENLNINIEVGKDEPLSQTLIKSLDTTEFREHERRRLAKKKETVKTLLEQPPPRYRNFCFINKESFEKFVNDFSEGEVDTTNLITCLQRNKIRILLRGKHLDLSKNVHELRLKPNDTLHILYRLPIFFNLHQYWFNFYNIQPEEDPTYADLCHVLMNKKGVRNPYRPILAHFAL